MPNPLSKVLPKATITYTGAALVGKPDLATLVATIFGLNSQLDMHMNMIIQHIVGPSGIATIMMFESLKADRVRGDALKAAAMHTLKGEQLKIFTATFEACLKAQKARNAIAHDLWCKADELPDALLLADAQEYRLTEANNQLSFHQMGEDISAGRDPIWDGPQNLGHSHIEVWTIRDLAEAADNLSQAITACMHLKTYLWASSWDVPPGTPTVGDLAHQQLCALPLIRQALDQSSRKGPNKSP
jgi:hypothetical protein